jgi:hypothetical protein
MIWIGTFGGRASGGAEMIAPKDRRWELDDEEFEVERFGFYL